MIVQNKKKKHLTRELKECEDLIIRYDNLLKISRPDVYKRVKYHADTGYLEVFPEKEKPLKVYFIYKVEYNK